MCGFSLFLTKDCINDHHCCCQNIVTNSTKALVENRGPDFTSDVKVEISEFLFLNVFASVLHLRGPDIIHQPFQDSNGNILLWNGEIFGGISLNADESDVEILANELVKLNEKEEILDIIGRIQGPWSLVYYQKSKNYLWFGRDVLGRRSLLWRWCSKCHSFNISSVSKKDLTLEWKEVPTTGLFGFELDEKCFSDVIFNLSHFSWSWQPSGSGQNSELELFESNWLQITSETLTVKNPITIPLNRSLEKVKSLDNIDFNIQDLNQLLLKFADCTEYQVAVTKLEELLLESVRKRIFLQRKFCNLSTPSAVTSDDVAIAILYSGGLDSIIIAALADKCLPNNLSIDLLNVAFEQTINDTQKKGKKSQSQNHVQKNFDVPDRQGGRSGLSELSNINPDRNWNFIEIDVSKSRLTELRENKIRHLIYPLSTVLDDSLGCAMWFASHGKGTLNRENGKICYQSSSPVILVGTGADELFCGYSRHRVRFKSEGMNCLLDEIAMELDRISTRNLGRDDRIISDHGKEARFPFLDENVINFVNSLPIILKANLELPRGVGEKLLLRILALKLGLKNASVRPKQAMQFGSRIAHLEKHNKKGSDLCEHLNSVSLNG